MFDRKEYNRQWNRDHKEECLESHRRWRENKKNKEKELEQNREYQRNNKEEQAERCKQWRNNNPEKSNYNLEKHKEYMKEWLKTEKGKANNQRGHSKRRAREKDIVNTLSAQEWIDILKEYKFRCAYCGCEFTLFNGETRDHVIPISKGGDNIRENIVPACRSCNAKKSNKIIKRKEV